MKPFTWNPGNDDHDPKWDEYFMGVALLSAMRSKDRNTQVGACVVNDEPRVIGIGYNGMPLNCHDTLMPWEEEKPQVVDDMGKKRKSSSTKAEGQKKEWKKPKHLYVCHSELNAIVNRNPKSVKGCTVYVTFFPCNECAKVIVRSGIKRVVYLSDEDYWKTVFTASRHILETAEHVELISFANLHPKVELTPNPVLHLFGDHPGSGEQPVITWKQYFMGLAILSGKVRSKDSKEGACVVDKDKRIVGLGYVQDVVSAQSLEDLGKKRKTVVVDKEKEDNRSKKELTQKEMDKALQDAKKSSFYVWHAPANAIVNESPASLRDCTIYVVRYPCNECAKVIVQSGIKKVVYLEKPDSVANVKASERMFAIAHITEKQYKDVGKTDTISLDFTEKKFEDKYSVVSE